MPLDGSEFKFEIDETTKLLIAARERIERGWCQNNFRNGRGEVCMLGAIGWDELCTRAATRARRRLAKAVGIPNETDKRHIPDWNDTEGRTKEEVIAAFDRAIASV